MKEAFFPYLFSFVIGLYALHGLLKGEQKIQVSLRFFLALGMGFGISANLAFYSFLIMHRFHAGLILGLHIACLLLLWLLLWWKEKRNPIMILQNFSKGFGVSDLLTLGLSGLAAFWVFTFSKTQPFGGWDAWAVWNLKAKFLLMEKENWRYLFLPVLWRSSPHYPLLLPLINVWGWVLAQRPLLEVPRIVSILFTVMTAGLLFSGLKNFTKLLPALAASLIILSLPIFLTFGTSQYSDIVLAFFLLACMVSLLSARHFSFPALSFVGGIFAGFMSFTKDEGLAATAILAILIVFYFPIHKRPWRRYTLLFWGGLILAGLPTFIFKLFLAPHNVTFINGLFSKTHPSTLYRLKIIMTAFLFEFKAKQWHAVFFFLIGVLLLSGKRPYRREISLIPLFLLCYASIIIFYYFLNTYFEIVWWIKTTLARIFFTVLPLFCFWSFLSLWSGDIQKNGPQAKT